MRTAVFFAGLLAACSTALAAGGCPQKKRTGFIAQKAGNATCDNHEEKVFNVMLVKSKYPDGRAERLAEDMQTSLDCDDVISVQRNTEFVHMVVNMTECESLQWNAHAEVNYVEQDVRVLSYATQKTGAPWGLQRISNDAGATGSPSGQNFTYSFDDNALGAGVDIYVIDTGVRTSHAVFTGRGTQGFTATGSNVDGDGHGTHVAGTAGGTKFGVAQAANIIAVKVLGDDGSGSSSDTIAGMDWVINNHNKRKTEANFKGSIMSMSWGLQGQAKAVDDVITAANNAGLHVSVAAGNDGVDACGSTPAHLGGSSSNVVTVGSININNAVSTFSNTGKCVDLFAPGEQILSAWSTGDNVINFLSGTSMACPHTTGVMAYLLSQDVAGLGQNPGALKKKLLSVARQSKVAGNLAGSPNVLLSNGVDGGIAKRLVQNYVIPGNLGSPAARAVEAVRAEGEWEMHSLNSPLRF